MSSIHSVFINAQKASASGDNTQALGLYRQIIKETSKGDDLWLMAALASVEIETIMGNEPENFELMKEIHEAIKIPSASISDDLRIHLNTSLSSSFMDRGEIDLAKEHLREAIKYYEEMPFDDEAYDIMLALVAHCKPLSMYDEAVSAVKFYLSRFHNEPPKRRHRQIMSIQVIADLYEKSSQLEKSKEIKAEYFQKKVSAYLRLKARVREDIPLPEDWGKDELTYYLHGAEHNTIASITTFTSIRESVFLLNAKYAVAYESGALQFSEMIRRKYPDVSVLTVQLSDEERLEFFFFTRTQSCLLSAARLALGGQIPESYCIMRAAIENALYAFAVANDESKKQIWLNRATNKKAVRDNFKFQDIFISMAGKYAALSKESKELYDLTIDEGAHPNANSYIKHAYQRADDTGLAIGLNLLDSDYIEESIAHLVKIGDKCLDIYRTIYPQWIW